MSVTSIRSARSITPIESPDDQTFFDAVIQDKPHSGSKVRADHLFGGHELDKQSADGNSELEKREIEVRELDKQDKGLQNFNSKNVIQVQVKANNEDEIDDIYDFDYVTINQNSEKGQSPENPETSSVGNQTLYHRTSEYFTERNDAHGKNQTDSGESVKGEKEKMSLKKAQNEHVEREHHDWEVQRGAQEIDVDLESFEKTEVKNVSKVKSISIHSGPRLEDILSDQPTLSLDSPLQRDETRDIDKDYNKISEERADGKRNHDKEDIQASTSHKEDNEQTNKRGEKQTSETFPKSHLIRNTGNRNGGNLHVSRDESDSKEIEFDDSVENSYFAMFKKSENNEPEEVDNRQPTEGNMETGWGKDGETRQNINENKTFDKGNVNVNKDTLNDDGNDTGGNVDIGLQEKSNLNDAEETGDDTKDEKKIYNNENDGKEHSTGHGQSGDAGQIDIYHKIETPQQSKDAMPKVTEDRRYVPDNEHSEKTDTIEYEQDEYYDNDSNDVDEPERKASARTLRSNTSTHTKSAHSHRASEPHRAIEEMNAMERLKHTPYTEHLAKGYSKHAISSSASHSNQQNQKQNNQRQHKSGADHKGGGEPKKVDHRGKTNEGVPLKKEPTPPRMGSGMKPGMEKKNPAPKEKKKFFRRKEKRPSVPVARPSTIFSDENMNEVKDVIEKLEDAKETHIPVVKASENLPPEKQDVDEQSLEPTAEVPAQVMLTESSPPIKADLPDLTNGPLITGQSETEKSPEDPVRESADTAVEEKTPAADTTTADDTVVDKEMKNEDENKSVIGKDNAEANGKGTPKSKKQKETAKAKTNGDDQKGSGPRNWFGGKKKQNQGDSSSVKNKTRPKSSLPVNGIIITTSSEDSPKSEESKLITDAKPVPEVPAALTIVDETKSEPHGKAGRVVLANIKQKLLKDSSLSGSHSSVPALPLSQRSRSPSPETSFSSSNGSKLAKVAHKTQSMSSLQVPGAALTTPRDHGQDDDNVSITSRRDSASRRSMDYRIQDAAAAIAPDAADEKPKSVLTNDETFIKNAIPYLPLSLAIVCLLLNIVLPGSGTALSGLSILCCGQARVSNKNDQILTTLCANCLVGLAQLFTVTFLLVGWFWSIGWGIQMVSLSVQHREEVKKQRAKELQALALSAFGSPKRGAPFGP